jgi:hypothetical protein
MPAAALAQAISQPVALRPMDRKSLFGAVLVAGGNPTELRQLYAYSAYMNDIETALGDGDLVAAQGLLLLCPIDLGPATQAAIGAVLAANTLRLVDVVAGETGEAAPVEIDADDVTAALTDAGYVWDGDNSEWVRAE